jgi:hypothetical protein
MTDTLTIDLQEPGQQGSPAVGGGDNLDPLQLAAEIAARAGAHVLIVGSWIWATFDQKPDRDTLEILKRAHFIWCTKKGKWAWRDPDHKVYSRRTMDWSHIVLKYGIEEYK